MKKLIFFTLIILMYSLIVEYANAQSCTYLNNITLTSDSTINITGTKKYCSYSTKNGGSHSLTFVIKPSYGNTVIFDNLKLINFDKVIFKIEKAAKIYLKNSTFTDVGQVEFQYEKENLLYNSYTTEYFIQDNDFNNEVIFDQMYSSLLKFSPSAANSNNFVVSETYLLNNVRIENNTFIIGNNPSLFPSSNPKNKRSSIAMNRETDNNYVRNIKILNNEILMMGQRVLGIDFAHNFPNDVLYGDPNNNNNPYDHYDMTQPSLYEGNKNISIKRNNIIAESTYPHYGIFVQGPYKNVQVKYNTVKGFGLTSVTDLNHIKGEGNIDLYGSRSESYYSNNIKGATIQFNYIVSNSHGIRVSGGEDILIHKNHLQINSWPEDLDLSSSPDNEVIAGIKVAGGNTLGSAEEIGTKNIDITYNSINLNNLPTKVGILVQHMKNFKIQNNEIDNLKSVGIYYYSNSRFYQDENNIAMGIGTSFILNNTMDYESNDFAQNLADDIYQVDNRAIALQRATLNYPAGESLNIYGNKVESNNAISYYMNGYTNVYKHGDWSDVSFPSGSNNISIYSKTESSAPIKHVTSGDFNGDGLDEYVIRNNENEYFVVFADDHDDPNFDVQHWSPIDIFWGDSNYESKLKTGDINGDGKDDLIFLNKGNDEKFKLRVALSTGGSFQQFKGYNFPSSFDNYQYLNMAIGNFNNDDEDEIAIRTPHNDYSVIHLNLNNGSLSRNSVWSDPNISNDSWYEPQMESGDFNDDGYDDLYILRRDNNGQWKIRVMTYEVSQNGFDGQSGYSQIEMDAEFDTNQSYVGFAVADFNGDDYADVALRHKSDEYFVIKSNGNQLTSMESWKNGYVMWADSDHPTQILPGNVDGNDRTDLFVWGQHDAGTYYFRAARSQNNSGDKFHRFNGWLINFNSDGEPDLTPSKVNPSDGDRKTEVPEEFELLQNYPNPFNPVTTITYKIPASSYVEIEIYSVTGQKISTLVRNSKSPGVYTEQFNAGNLSSGIYIYQLKINGDIFNSKKFTLIK